MSSSNQTATEQNLARINALNENYPEIAKNTHKAKMAESLRKAHLSGKFDDMAQAFIDRFGDKWNDDWFVEDLREFCDGIVRMNGCESLSRYMDYGRMVETMCKEEGYTICRLVEYDEVEWYGEDAHDFDYQETAWASTSPDYDENNKPIWKCATEGMWLITNADIDLLEDTDLLKKTDERVYDFDTTIVRGIVCRKCSNTLPDMTMTEHLEGKFNLECPHTPLPITE